MPVKTDHQLQPVSKSNLTSNDADMQNKRALKGVKIKDRESAEAKIEDSKNANKLAK